MPAGPALSDLVHEFACRLSVGATIPSENRTAHTFFMWLSAEFSFGISGLKALVSAGCWSLLLSLLCWCAFLSGSSQ